MKFDTTGRGQMGDVTWQLRHRWSTGRCSLSEVEHAKVPGFEHTDNTVQEGAAYAKRCPDVRLMIVPLTFLAIEQEETDR